MRECKCCDGQGVHDDADGCVPCAGTGSVSDFICGHDRVHNLQYHMCCSWCGGRQDSSTYQNIERTMNEHLVEVHDVIRSRIQDAFAKSWALLLSQRTPADMR